MQNEQFEKVHATVMLRHPTRSAAKATKALGRRPSWSYPADQAHGAPTAWGIESFLEAGGDAVEDHLSWAIGILTRFEGELTLLKSDGWNITVTLTVPRATLEKDSDRTVAVGPSRLAVLARLGASLALFVP